MTSLSNQLRNLQIPDTLSVLNLQDKRASILFEAHEAADVDVDTIFALGRTGLEELQRIDSDFEKFDKTLFSESFKALERTQQPREFNQRLDKKIEEFLVCLSPYFLIKPSQKALEWLIRRFRIHVFNVNALMCCVLPFHETKLFARVLTIITFNKQTEKWDWLAQVQKSGIPLPKSVLIQHCLSDSSFLAFICEMIPQAIEIKHSKSLDKLKTLCSFYASVLLGVAESSKNLSESMIGKMLPYLYQGLKSNFEDYKVSSYLVLSQMCLMKTFKEQITSSLVDQICKSLSGATSSLGILALECIYRHQKTKQISTKGLRLICNSKDLLKQVSNLADEDALVSFLPVFLSSLLNVSLIATQSEEVGPQNRVDYGDVGVRFLQNTNFEPSAVRFILRKLLEHYIKLREASSSQEGLLKAGQEFLQILEKRYPTETDSVLQGFISKQKSLDETEWIQELIMVGQSGAKFKSVPGTDTSLLLSLNHPDPGRRRLAVHELIKVISLEDEEMKDQTFAKSSLLQRMNDDNDSVVDEVFKGGAVLLKVVEKEAIVDAFLQKMRSANASQRSSLVKSLIEIFKGHTFLAELPDKKSINLIAEIVVSLMPSKQSLKEQTSLWKLLRCSTFASLNPLIKGISDTLESIDVDSVASLSSVDSEITKIYKLIFKNAATVLLSDANKNSLITVSLEWALLADVDHPFKLFFLGVLFNLVHKLDKDDLVTLVHQMEPFLRSTTLALASLKGKSKYLNPFLKSKNPEECLERIIGIAASKKEGNSKDHSRFAGSNLFCLFLRKIIEQLPVSNNGETELSLDTSSLLFELLASASGRSNQNQPYVAVFRILLQEFLKKHFPSPKALLDFLSHMFMEPSALEWIFDKDCNFSKIDAHICALHIFKVCLETLSKDIDFLVSLECEVLPSLMVMLHHPLRIVRETSIGCIQGFHDNNVVKLDNGLAFLLDCVIDNDTEIVEDCNQICLVLGRLFKPLCDTNEDVEMLEPRRLEDLRLLTKYFSGFLLRSNISLKVGVASLTAAMDFQEFLVYLMPTIEGLITKAQTKGLSSHEFKLLQLMLKKFGPRSVQIFEKFPSSLVAFKTALCIGEIVQETDMSVQNESLKQVTTPFYESISPRETKKQIFDALLKAAINSSNSNVIKAIRRKLIELPIDSDDMANQIACLKDDTDGSEPKTPKRAKRAAKVSLHIDALNMVDTVQWNKVVLLLEVIQLKTNVTFSEKLILSLFDLLSLCLDMDATNQPSIEYMKQLLLSSVRKIVDDILKSSQKDALSQEKFSIEKVIECFRTSENPQTHHQALLLLGRAASLFPDLVLHNVMSIFTFMGANVMRQDDSYSFEIIKKTIDAVIPTLVPAGTAEGWSKEGPSTDDIVKLVVRVFVDAIPYVPEHRRMLLFEHFSTVLGATNNLYAVIAMLLEKLMVQMDYEKKCDNQSVDGRTLAPDFPLVLIRNFSLQEQAMTIKNLICFLSKLPDEKQEEKQTKRANTRSIKKKNANEELVPLFDATKYSTKDIQKYKYCILDFVSKVLVDRDFIEKASAADKASKEKLYLCLLEEILQYACVVGEKTGMDQKVLPMKYWKIQQQKFSELINKVYNLLTFDTFINVTSHLMQNKHAIIRKKVIELIREKTKTAADLNQKETSKLLTIAKSLVQTIRKSSDEVPGNKQIALQTLRPLLVLLSKNHAEDLTETVDVFIDLLSSAKTLPQISASSLLCIGELASCLNVHMIKFLPSLMPSVIQLLTDESEWRDVIVISSLVALQKIIGSLSKFMSPYVKEIVQIITCTRFDTNVEGKSSSAAAQIKAKTMALRGEISQNITPRILLPALDSCFDVIVQSNKHSLISLMDIVHQAVESMSRDSIKANHIKILALFLKALDVRCFYSEKSKQDVGSAEEKIISAFCTLVMKTSENTFRPMFLKIVNWSTSSDNKNTRLITFYRLCHLIAEKLKGLFLLFAGHIIKPCAELIAKCNMKSEALQLFDEDNEANTNLLLSHVFDCLQKCFLHDSQGFLNKERYEYLLSPLIDQLDNYLGGTSAYNERVLNHLNPCLAYFAVAINDESCWKTLNYQILLKTRNQTPQVRFAALNLLEEIHKRIGESYLILLPETIPFLAELMEDESFEVEKQCQQVISHMEEILGESLQKYF